jgi:Zn-dependent metalloprotease
VIFRRRTTGDKIYEYDNLQTGSGSSLYSGTVTINTSQSGSTFYMEDLTRKMGTFNMNSTGSETTGGGGTQSRYTDTDDVWNTTIQRAGVDAHWGARWTYDYYLNKHSRNGIDGAAARVLRRPRQQRRQPDHFTRTLSARAVDTTTRSGSTTV